MKQNGKKKPQVQQPLPQIRPGSDAARAEVEGYARELEMRIAECEDHGHKSPSPLTNRCSYCYRTLAPLPESLNQLAKGTREYNDYMHGIKALITEGEEWQRTSVTQTESHS